jgi:single-strand DNA-binding protein
MGTFLNICVLAGTVTSDPDLRELRNGLTVMQFDLTTPCGGANISVPVSWHEPTAAQRTSFGVGDDVVIIGSVRRRFFRVGGQTQSRTEVIVESLVPQRRAKSSRSVVAAAAERLTQAVE